MLSPLRFVGLLVILLAMQACCKPAKSSEGFDNNDYNPSSNYNDDDPPPEYNDDDHVDDPVDEDDDPSASEEPPQITSTPEDIRVLNGSTIYLPCDLKNAEKFTVTWKKADEFLYYDSSSMNADKKIERLENNTLVIHDATINDTNVYECSILKDPRSTITIRHKVSVEIGTQQHKPPLIRVIPAKMVELNAGENVTLGCETNLQTKSKMNWYHENKRMTTNGNQLIITNIKKHDAGRYQCLAEIGAKDPLVEAINVIVNYAPVIETKGRWVHTGLGVESRLTCVVHAHPHAKVTWLKDHKEVLPKKNSIQISANKTRHTLEILHTEKEHLGDYVCKAENRLGWVEKTISLTGIPSQAIISGGEMTSTASGQTLKWQLESYSPITEYKLEYRHKGDVNWTILKPAVTNGKGNQFSVEQTIEGLQPGSYEAILQAKNDFGWSQPSKPHTFIGEYVDEQQAEMVEGSSSGVSQPVLTIATLFLVVSSCAFTSL